MGQAPIQIYPSQMVSIPAREASAPKLWPGTDWLLTSTSAAQSPWLISPDCFLFSLLFHANVKHKILFPLLPVLSSPTT